MKVCKKCVLPETYPGIQFDDEGVCNVCRSYSEAETQETHKQFPDSGSLKRALESFKNPDKKYDVLVPLSGGLDSCFTLIQIKETFGLRPLVFHSDHGWDDPVATANVEKLCKELDVDLVIWKNELVFMRKLFRYFNQSKHPELSACHVCGNMLYLNGLELADNFGIPLVVNGYSKGQAAMMHDKDKAQDLYGKMIEIILETGDREFFETFTKKWQLLEKQVIYSQRGDLERGPQPGKLLFIPFFIFKFYKTQKDKLEQICRERFDWQPIPASYPANTTNCKMIWLNSWMDLKRRHYTHYHDEYSTLIRAGEMTREQVLNDLELDPPKGLLEELAEEIGLPLEEKAP
jgi:endogenous inhibitor of DNA gyrase (YacG/DUF329 family)